MSKDPLGNENRNSLKYRVYCIQDDAKKVGNKIKGMK